LVADVFGKAAPEAAAAGATFADACAGEECPVSPEVAMAINDMRMKSIMTTVGSTRADALEPSLTRGVAIVAPAGRGRSAIKRKATI
jgi:hypothetical protein